MHFCNQPMRTCGFRDKDEICRMHGALYCEYRTTETPKGGVSNSSDLLSCPFCGCEAHSFKWSEVAGNVECMNPDCHATITAGSKEEAIKLWNSRAV